MFKPFENNTQPQIGQNVVTSHGEKMIVRDTQLGRLGNKVYVENVETGAKRELYYYCVAPA